LRMRDRIQFYPRGMIAPTLASPNSLPFTLRMCNAQPYDLVIVPDEFAADGRWHTYRKHFPEANVWTQKAVVRHLMNTSSLPPTNPPAPQP
jgi:hypothetical protein